MHVKLISYKAGLYIRSLFLLFGTIYCYSECKIEQHNIIFNMQTLHVCSFIVVWDHPEQAQPHLVF